MFSITKMSVEIEGSVNKVIRIIQQLGGAGQRAAAGDDGGSIEMPTGSGDETMPAASARMSGAADEASPEEWTETLVSKFPAGMEPVARQMVLHVGGPARRTFRGPFPERKPRPGRRRAGPAGRRVGGGRLEGLMRWS